MHTCELFPRIPYHHLTVQTNRKTQHHHKQGVIKDQKLLVYQNYVTWEMCNEGPGHFGLNFYIGITRLMVGLSEIRGQFLILQINT